MTQIYGGLQTYGRFQSIVNVNSGHPKSRAEFLQTFMANFAISLPMVNFVANFVQWKQYNTYTTKNLNVLNKWKCTTTGSCL